MHSVRGAMRTKMIKTFFDNNHQEFSIQFSVYFYVKVMAKRKSQRNHDNWIGYTPGDEFKYRTPEGDTQLKILFSFYSSQLSFHELLLF